MTSGYEFTSESQLQTAVDWWCSDEAYAITTYGDINTWDVSNITLFSNLFDGKTVFNSDITNWDVSS